MKHSGVRSRSRWTTHSIVAIILLGLQLGCEKPLMIGHQGASQWEGIGLDTVRVTRLVLSAPYLYACAGPRGLYRRNIRAAGAWEYLGSPGLPPSDVQVGLYDGVTDVSVIGSDILVSFEGFLGATSDHGVGLWRSTDAGHTFARSDSGIIAGLVSFSYASSVVRSPFDPAIGIAIWGSIYRTTTGGTSWYYPQPQYEFGSYEPWFHSVRWQSTGHDRVWIYGVAYGGASLLAVSTDAGQTWKRYSLAQLGLEENCVIFDIGFDGTDPGVVYLATCPHLIKSTDDGETWFSTQRPEEPVYRTLATHPRIHDLVYLSPGSTVFRSTDGARTVFCSLGSPNGTMIRSMIVDGAVGDLYVAASTGVFRF